MDKKVSKKKVDKKTPVKKTTARKPATKKKTTKVIVKKPAPKKSVKQNENKVKTVAPKEIEVKVEETIIKDQKRKISKVEESEKLYIYGALIAILLVLSNTIVNIPFEIFGVALKLSAFVYPFIFLFSCIILKKYGVVEVIEALIVAIVVQLMMFFLRWIIVGNINVGIFVSTFISFSISQVACLCLYSILLKNKLDTFFYIFLIFTICILFDNGVFLSLLKNFGDSTITLNTLNVSNLIKILISLLISYIIMKKE